MWAEITLKTRYEITPEEYQSAPGEPVTPDIVKAVEKHNFNEVGPANFVDAFPENSWELEIVVHEDEENEAA